MASATPLDPKSWSEAGVINLDDPPGETLSKLSQLPITPGDIELIFGDAPGFQVGEFGDDMRGLWDALLRRITFLVCEDEDLRRGASLAVNGGAAAVWLLLCRSLGLSAGSVAATLLQPFAIGVATDGLERLCIDEPNPS